VTVDGTVITTAKLATELAVGAAPRRAPSRRLTCRPWPACSVSSRDRTSRSARAIRAAIAGDPRALGLIRALT
jgi:hypothetical protein